MSLLTAELLIAYVDNKLNPTERKLISDAARMDPQLRRQLDDIKKARSSGASDSNTPVRERKSNPHVLFIKKRTSLNNGTREHPHQSCSPQSERRGHITESLPPIPTRRVNVMAMLAMLALGFAMHWGLGWGSAVYGSKNEELLVVHNTSVFASGSLQAALETAGNAVITTRPDTSQHITPLLTFRDRRNLFCREYDVDTAWDRQFSGLACRLKDGAWRIEAHFATGLSNAPEKTFAPASNGAVAIVEQVSERMKIGRAFNDGEVEALVTSGWRDK